VREKKKKQRSDYRGGYAEAKGRKQEQKGEREEKHSHLRALVNLGGVPSLLITKSNRM